MSVGVHELNDRQGETTAELRALRSELAWISQDVRRSFDGVAAKVAGEPAALASLDEPTADYLNAATGYLGLAAQAGVFVNEPIILHYGPGEVRLTDVNERIVELPFVFRELGALERGAAVVDVGSSESTVSLSLASLGYDVTAADPRGYGFTHPSLVTLPDIGAAADASFDGAVVLSTIEHVGVAHYGLDSDPDADITLMSVLASKVRPGGLVLLTTPYGDGRDAGFQRIYDHHRLASLMASFDVERIEIAQRFGTTEWRVTAADFDHLPVIDDDEYRVAMIAARAKG
jgi:2-polyprenyl-3-methyl-5-hydroxy-6-metoxy-1,4-benzoquinol methylase